MYNLPPVILLRPLTIQSFGYTKVGKNVENVENEEGGGKGLTNQKRYGILIKQKIIIYEYGNFGVVKITQANF
jgi:hypothetical protein